MNWKGLPQWLKGGIIGGTIFSLMYIIPLIILKDPDFITQILGLFGMIVWLVQWISFLIGGWILAILSTIIFFIITGFIIGAIVGKLINNNFKIIKNLKTKPIIIYLVSTYFILFAILILLKLITPNTTAEFFILLSGSIAKIYLTIMLIVIIPIIYGLIKRKKYSLYLGIGFILLKIIEDVFEFFTIGSISNSTAFIQIIFKIILLSILIYHTYSVNSPKKRKSI